MHHHPTETLSPEQFVLLREVIERTSGIVLGAGKLSHLDSVVRERMGLSGETDTAKYLARVFAESPLDGERKALVTALLVGETSFFRTPAMYAVLQRKLLPEIAAAGVAFPLRIWSAGCATGEEPYSLAIAALQAFDGRRVEPVRILATDLHAGFLDVAREGIYPASALRDVSPLLVMKYFRLLPDGRYRVSDEVRRLVTFEHRNLSEKFRQDAGQEKVSAIFCRNVMIYFRSDTTRRVVASFHERLADGGLFFLGHSETLWGISNAFRLEERDGLFFYRKKDEGEIGIPSGAPKAPGRSTKRVRAPVSPPRPPAARASVPISAPVPAAPVPEADAVALAMAQRAERLMDSDRIEEAESICRDALALYPACAEAEYLMSVLMRGRGRCKEALAHAARALLADPKFVQAAVEIAECLALQGKRNEAAAQWRAVLAMLDLPVQFPRLSPATGMTVSALRDYAATRTRVV